ncbi:hypothetical protein [Erwinia aphidicola]|uniref:hypothetical protein n=1 Tax=Erwinia aphidicola TaxID=68334 RepID=UPI00301B1270
MRRITINGAVFMFMDRGEKLTEADTLPRNGVPDGRYVLWPRGDQWDVRYLVVGSGGNEWRVIANHLFPNEGTAWQAALEHGTERQYRMTL